MSFERARQPEQKEQRREAILEAAACVLSRAGLAEATLSAIARAARLSKANLYRYFESREAIYLSLLEADYEAVAASFERALVPLAGKGDLDAVAKEVARALASRPRALELLSSIASVLERNVSADFVRDFKRRMTVLAARPVFALHAAVPGLSVEDAEKVMRMTLYFAGGLYPATQPGPVVASVLAEPEFAHMRFDFEQSVEDHARLLLKGMLAG